ncbi:hypothetical protein ACHAPB_005536 [Verticillium nonalfalfae]
MAEEQKPVAVEAPEEDTTTPVVAPAVEAPVAEAPVEAKPVEATEAAPAAAATTEAATTTEAAPEAAAAAEETKEEVVPVEEGQLEHKGLNFPKNFIYSKQFFWFGTDAVEPSTLSHYRRSEKNVEAGRNTTAWASQTGKGLLFFGEKASPVGVINLSEATEPVTDGPNKFFFTAKGHKHAFKASSTAERDNWVEQLKVKIAEAKELATTVPETETYKATLETFKPSVPAPAAKKEEDKPAEVAAPATETPTVVEPVAAPATTEAAAAEEPVKEEKKERRSASRKRGSIFGNLLGGKKEEKTEKPVEATAEAPATETPAVAAETTTEPAAPVAAEAAPATEAAVAPAAAAESPTEEKPAPLTKRNSIFGSVFGKKEKKAAETETPAAPAKEAEVAPVAQDAPVIPQVETTTPLAVEVASPATVPTETTEAAPAAAVAEPKKEAKAEKRKSSLPFAFGKKEKSPATSDEEGDKPEKTGPFSKLRATIKGRGKSPVGEKKPLDKTAEEKTESATEAPATEAPASGSEAPKLPEEPVNKPEPVTGATPAVTAAA